MSIVETQPCPCRKFVRKAGKLYTCECDHPDLRHEGEVGACHGNEPLPGWTEATLSGNPY